MTILSLPPSPGIQECEYSFSQPSQVNRSEFTSRRRVTILEAAPRLSTRLKVVQIIGETAFRPWRAFIVGLRGRAGAFYLPLTEGPQNLPTSAGGVQVDGAGQTGFTLATKGWWPQANIPVGCMVTVADQPLVVTASGLAGEDGKVTLHFEPHLRAASVDGAAIEVQRPYAVMSRTEDSNGYTVKPGQLYSVEFPCEESF